MTENSIWDVRITKSKAAHVFSRAAVFHQSQECCPFAVVYHGVILQGILKLVKTEWNKFPILRIKTYDEHMGSSANM